MTLLRLHANSRGSSPAAGRCSAAHHRARLAAPRARSRAARAPPSHRGRPLQIAGAPLLPWAAASPRAAPFPPWILSATPATPHPHPHPPVGYARDTTPHLSATPGTPIADVDG